MEISNGKIVKLVYKGTLDDGSVFDSNSKDNPLKIVIGFNMIIPGLERELIGMKEGDKKTINVKAEDAYGPRDDNRTLSVPKSQFPPELELKEGMMLVGSGPNNEEIPVVVKEVKENEVIVDTNHPLAGKDLTFEIEVVSVEEGTPEKIKETLTEIFGELPNVPSDDSNADHNCANCQTDCPSRKDDSSIDDLLGDEKKE